MTDIERSCNGNELYIGVKRPEGLDAKWSERSASIYCGNCGSDNVSCGISGSVVTAACLNCNNWSEGGLDRCLGYYNETEEPRPISAPDGFEVKDGSR